MAKENAATQQQDTTTLATVSVTAPVKAGETSGTAVASQARALVEARFVMAAQRPRDWDDVRTRLLKACRRTGFAEAAIYAKPIGGKKMEGPSIRFAEEAARAMGNLDIDSSVLWDDAEKRIVRQRVTDLETNTTYSLDITIEKTVERKGLKEGQEPLGTRLNSYGDLVYLVRATEDDLLTKAAALTSKAIRTNVLRVLPSDIRDEAMQEARATMISNVTKDPDAARKRVVDSFFSLHIAPSELKRYLGHDVATCNPKELEELRAIFTAIREGDTNWTEVMRAREAVDTTGEAVEGAPPKSKAQAAKDAVKARVQSAKAAGADIETGELPVPSPEDKP